MLSFNLWKRKNYVEALVGPTIYLKFAQNSTPTTRLAPEGLLLGDRIDHDHKLLPRRHWILNGRLSGSQWFLDVTNKCLPEIKPHLYIVIDHSSVDSHCDSWTVKFDASSSLFYLTQIASVEFLETMARTGLEKAPRKCSIPALLNPTETPNSTSLPPEYFDNPVRSSHSTFSRSSPLYDSRTPPNSQERNRHAYGALLYPINSLDISSTN